jgi:hypothetical protein
MYSKSKTRVLDKKSMNSRVKIQYLAKNDVSPGKHNVKANTTYGSARSSTGFSARFVKLIRPDIDKNTAQQIFNVNETKMYLGTKTYDEYSEYEQKLKKLNMDEKVVKENEKDDLFRLKLKNKDLDDNTKNFALTQIINEVRLRKTINAWKKVLQDRVKNRQKTKL